MTAYSESDIHKMMAALQEIQVGPPVDVREAALKLLDRVKRNNKEAGKLACELCRLWSGDCTCLPQGSPDEHYGGIPGTVCHKAMLSKQIIL